MSLRIYSPGLKAQLNQDYDITDTDKLKCLLIKTGSSINTENPTTLGGFTTLNECTDTGYSPVSATGVDFTNGSGNAINITVDNVTFAGAGDTPSDEFDRILFAINTGATKANWIPFAYLDLDQSYDLTSAGRPVSIGNNRLGIVSESSSSYQMHRAGLIALLKQQYNPTTYGVIRALLNMSGHSCITDTGKATLSAFTTLGESDDTGYDRVQVGSSGSPITVVSVAGSPNYVKLHSQVAMSFPNSSDGTDNTIEAITYYLHVDGTNGNDIPLFTRALTAFELTGTTRTLTPATDGLMKILLP